MRVLVFIASAVKAWTIPARHLAELRRRFADVVFVPAGTRDEAVRGIPGAHAAFASDFTRPMLEAAPELRWIHSPAAGVGHLLFPELVASAVSVTNSRGLHAQSMAEHVLAVVLALARRLPEAMRHQAARRWAQDDLFETPGMVPLRGAHMGIVGLGAAGAAIGRLAAATGMRVSGVRRDTSKPAPEGVSAVYPWDDLAGLLPSLDVLVLAAPLTRDTHGLIGTRELGLLRPHAMLVNIARGGLVHEADLIEALRSGGIRGAALDVFEEEPLAASSPLWDMPNVLITPHTSGQRSDYWDAALDLFGENLQRFRRGAALLNVVDKHAGY